MKSLDPTEIRILQILEEVGAVRGNVLRRKATIPKPDDMVSAINHLLDLDLIAASGSTTDGKSLMSAYLSLVPSTRGLARKAVKKQF